MNVTKKENVINKVCLDENLQELETLVSYKEKDCNEFELHNNKQSLEDLQYERTVGTSIQSLYDKGLFDKYSNGNAYEVLKYYLLNERGRNGLEEVNDVVH